MALFFNLDLLEKEALDDSKKFIALLNYHYNGTSIPKSKNTKYKPIKLNGYSFILNPAPLFKLANVDINYIVQYIKLAGRRDYMLYKFYNQKFLDTSYFPDLLVDNIVHNPLLKIVNNQIKFKYEEL